MANDPHGTRHIPAGTPVIAADGSHLGLVRETHPHYLLVDQEDNHLDLDVPVHAIAEFANDTLRLSVNREALTEVDHEETVHRTQVDPD